MNLKIYLVKNRLTIKEFCEKIGYSRNQISGIINGRIKPSKRLALVIENATGGKVKAEEVMSEYKANDAISEEDEA